MKLIKGFRNNSTSRIVLLLSLVLLTAACSQTQEGMDVPTLSSATTAITTAASPVKAQLLETQNSGVTGSCQVSRTQNGDLGWSMRISGATPGSTISFYLQDDNSTFDGFETQATSQGSARSGKQVYSPAPAPGTMISCGVNEIGRGGVAYSQSFPAP